MKKLLLSDLKLTNRLTKTSVTVPAGTTLAVSFRTDRPSKVRCEKPDETFFFLSSSNAHKYLGAPFTKQPSLKTLERWSDDGIARSLTGGKCEPDGFSSDNAPSWLLSLGMI